MADEQRERTSYYCAFRTGLDNEAFSARLREIPTHGRWMATYGPIGVRLAIFTMLGDGVGVEIWRDGGGHVFASSDTRGNVASGAETELFGMLISIFKEGISAVAEADRERVHEETRDRILRRLGAAAVPAKGLDEILAAEADGREVLDLSGLEMTELPREIGRLQKVEALDLSRNRLVRLPEEIGRLTKLEELIVSENQLVELPREIGKLTRLTLLVLDHNQLVVLPAEIGKLTELIKLVLNDNGLHKLPAEIGKLVKLRYLWLQHNRLTALPLEFSQLERLNDWVPDGKHLPPRHAWALELHGNPLVDPPPEVIRKGSQAVRDYLKASMMNG